MIKHNTIQIYWHTLEYPHIVALLAFTTERILIVDTITIEMGGLNALILLEEVAPDARCACSSCSVGSTIQ